MVTPDVPQQEARGEAPIRVLLVTSDPDVLDAMRRAFSRPGFSIASEAWPGIDAVRRATALRPDVVMLHVEEPIIPALRTAQSLVEATSAGLAVISSADDIETVRRVMNAGAHDFATLPLSDDELRDAALRAAHRVDRRRATESAAPKSTLTGTVITVAGPRGGVGKSTIAANLAIELTRTTRSAVVLADLDLLFGSVAMMLDVLPNFGLQDWKQDRLRQASTAAAPYLTEHRTGVRLLAAPTDPDASIEVTPGDVSDLLTDLRSTYDYVILDTAPGLSDMTLAAIEGATFPLLVTSPELGALRATARVVDTLRGRGMPLERLQVVVNYSRDWPLAANPAEEVGLPVRWEIRHDIQVLRAAAAGRPVSEHKPGAAMPRALREIVEAAAATSVEQGRPEAAAAGGGSRRRRMGMF